MTPVERLLATAKAENGYLEKASNSQLDSKTANAGDKNFTKFARDLDALGFYNGRKNGYAWCDIFVDWCFVQTFGMDLALKMTGQRPGGYGASTTESVKYYRAMGRFREDGPQPGDQIFFSRNNGQSFYHSGLVTRVEEGRVFTIEGNTSSAPGVVENGGAVRKKSYRTDYSQIGGYGRPDYSLIQEDNDMTQDQFNEMFKTAMDAYRDSLRDNDSSPWSREAREYAVSSGLFTGSGAEPDGQPNFMWEDLLTREQCALLFYRFAQKNGLTA